MSDETLINRVVAVLGKLNRAEAEIAELKKALEEARQEKPLDMDKIARGLSALRGSATAVIDHPSPDPFDTPSPTGSATRSSRPPKAMIRTSMPGSRRNPPPKRTSRRARKRRPGLMRNPRMRGHHPSPEFGVRRSNLM